MKIIPQLFTIFQTQYTLFLCAEKAEASSANPMFRLLPTLNLRPDFHAVVKGEHHPAIRIDHCIIHKPMEQLLIEIHGSPRSAKPYKEDVKMSY